MRTTDVFLREEKDYARVGITSDDKPEVDEKILKKWQSIINLIANIMNVPSGLIMKITDSHMEVFLKSETENNPYPEDGSDSLGHGLYCETVIGRDRELEVVNALEEEMWKDNPDVSLDMISYLGYPIKWPDQEFFGTICVLDSKSHHYPQLYKDLIKELKSAIELDLELLLNQSNLKYYAEMDFLTGAYNRRKTEMLVEYEFIRSSRNRSVFSLALFDLDRFKYVNDHYGHEVGDQVLATFTKAFKSILRRTDIFGRWGGDEFVLICPDTELEGLETLIRDARDGVLCKIKEIAPEAAFSYGCSAFTNGDLSYETMVKRADSEMYERKGYKE